MKVLVTRPTLFSKTLSDKLKHCHIEVVHFPTIAIEPPQSSVLFQAGIAQLATSDIAIFVSRTAVHFAGPLLEPFINRTPAILWAAVGPGTAASLHALKIPQVIFPRYFPYGAQALLEQSEFSDIQQKTIVLFQGNPANFFLERQLVSKGATVYTVESYKRGTPKLDTLSDLPWKPAIGFDAIVCTSKSGLHNLLSLLSPYHIDLKNVPLIVISRSMHESANALDFKYPVLAMGADDASIIETLIKLKG